MCFGLPARTRNTIEDVYGEELSGKRFAQSGAIDFDFVAMASMS